MFCAEIDLMCRILEFCEHPELFSGYDAVDIVGYIVVYLVICHCADQYHVGEAYRCGRQS